MIFKNTLHEAKIAVTSDLTQLSISMCFYFFFAFNSLTLFSKSLLERR